MGLPLLDDINFTNKTVVLRADLDVPATIDGHVADDTRLRAFLPTLIYILEHNAKVIIIGHRGRPNGKYDKKLSMKYVAARLEELAGQKVTFCPDCIGEETTTTIKSLKLGDIALLENTRFYNEEKDNNAEFAKKLSHNADVFVLDAFASAHREDASVCAIVDFVKEKCVGRVVEKETKGLQRVLSSAAKPLVAIIAGSKISTKIGVITTFLDKADAILIGGAMANTFLKAQGHNIGNSKYEEDEVETANEILIAGTKKNVPIFLPIDAITAESLEDTQSETDSIHNISSDMMILDIGPRTLMVWTEIIKNAATIIWNGPVGAFEFARFNKGTDAIARAVANSNAFTVVGGGDTRLALINATIPEDKISLLSTAGGAMLKYLEGSKMPALDAINK